MPDLLLLVAHVAHVVMTLAVIGSYFVAAVTGFTAWSIMYRRSKSLDAFGDPISVYVQFIAPPGVRHLLRRFVLKRIKREHALTAMTQFAVLSSFAASTVFFFLKIGYFADNAWTPPVGYLVALSTLWGHSINAIGLTAFHLAVAQYVEGLGDGSE